MSYAGDVTCKECFENLQKTKSAQLVDVRTTPEWIFVGLPDLNTIGKDLHKVEWQQALHSDFVAAVERLLKDAGADKDSEIYCLCRSGVRSIAAAQALTQAGFTKAYNVLDGFEGNHNQHGQRGTVRGWKFEKLPWSQN